ncbi:phosphatidylserine decarboxylase, partial [Streptomyces sp900105245]|uniref:phosphatidylserine decarboxylase n=1 Tax=Streptomyces sp. 900105245 TaxID=3154379 RepID=UPI00331F4C95
RAVAVPATALAAGMLWFFRDPEREIATGRVISPRIVPHLPEGTKVEQGARIGLIRFGSRVDLYLPGGVEVAVEVGQKTVAGITRLDRN